MQVQEKERLFNQCKELITGAVVKAYQNTGKQVEIQDLFGEANLIFCECLEKFNKEKGTFQKYLSNALFHLLYRYAKRENFVINQLQENFALIVDKTDCYIEKEPLSFFMDSLSNEAQMVIDCAFSYPSNKSKERLFKIVRQTLGWSKRKINHTFYEIEGALM